MDRCKKWLPGGALPQPRCALKVMKFGFYLFPDGEIDLRFPQVLCRKICTAQNNSGKNAPSRKFGSQNSRKKGTPFLWAIDPNTRQRKPRVYLKGRVSGRTGRGPGHFRSGCWPQFWDRRSQFWGRFRFQIFKFYTSMLHPIFAGRYPLQKFVIFREKFRINYFKSKFNATRQHVVRAPSKHVPKRRGGNMVSAEGNVVPLKETASKFCQSFGARCLCQKFVKGKSTQSEA